MKVPTITQFNNWSPKDKLWYIDYETAGKFKGMIKERGYFPLLVYPAENVGIVYQVNTKGELIEAEAMTVKEAFDRLERFKSASKAVLAIN